MGISDYKEDEFPFRRRLGAYVSVVEAILHYTYFDPSSSRSVESLQELLQAFA
jgi:hypothetical protein